MKKKRKCSRIHIEKRWGGTYSGYVDLNDYDNRGRCLSSEGAAYTLPIRKTVEEVRQAALGVLEQYGLEEHYFIEYNDSWC